MERDERRFIAGWRHIDQYVSSINQWLGVRFNNLLQRLIATFRRDMRQDRHVVWAGALCLATVLATVLYYRGMPSVELDPDTPAYLNVAHQIVSQGVFVDPARLPGYPVFVCIIFWLTRSESLAAVSIAQAGLFVIATLELYALLFLILHRSWAAAVGAALMGTNSMLLSYIKPIMSEALTLFLVVNLALAVVLFVRTPRLRTFWLATAWLLVLFMTRPEWIFLPPLLFACLLALAHRRNDLRRLLPHTIAAVAILYAVLGLYIVGNATRNHFVGVTFVSNINLLGKVMQYHMVDEAPPAYASITRIVDRYLARGDGDPWQVTGQNQPLKQNHFSLSAQYSEAIILRHPIEYLGDSFSLMWASLAADQPYRPLPQNVWSSLWGWAASAIQRALVAFPVAACLWWALLLSLPGFRKRRRPHIIQALAASRINIAALAVVALLAAYGLAVTTLGGYIMYERLHTPFDPLLIVVIWATLIACGAWLASISRAVHTSPHPRRCRRKRPARARDRRLGDGCERWPRA